MIECNDRIALNRAKMSFFSVWGIFQSCFLCCKHDDVACVLGFSCDNNEQEKEFNKETKKLQPNLIRDLARTSE
jgi:hypothetical protein